VQHPTGPDEDLPRAPNAPTPGGPAPTGIEAKSALRDRLLTARRSDTAPTAGTGPAGREPTGADIAITRRVLALPEVAAARCVAAFVGIPGEPDTRLLIEALRGRGARVLLPVVRGDLDLDFRAYHGTLVPGAMGTREPPIGGPSVDLAAADVVIVPAVAVDRTGRRLGRGGGSYDRALRRIRPGAALIALVHDREVVDEVPVGAHDLPVSIVVTASRTLWCRPG
jgi:5-formyltetrahydrofolate cyclo-ligase